MNIHMYIAILEWCTGSGLGSPTVSTSHQKSQKSGSCLILETECLKSPNLALKFQGLPRQLQVFSLVCIEISKHSVWNLLVLPCPVMKIDGKL